jgi:hypothetical protein
MEVMYGAGGGGETGVPTNRLITYLIAVRYSVCILIKNYLPFHPQVPQLEKTSAEEPPVNSN